MNVKNYLSLSRGFGNWRKNLIMVFELMISLHFVKSVCVRSHSGPHFSAFRLNMERYSVPLCIQSKCGKMRTRVTPNTDTFDAVLCIEIFSNFFTFYIWVALEYYCHFKNCIKFYMPNRQYLITKSNLRKNI